MVLGLAERTWDDRKSAQLGIAAQVRFLDVREWPDDDMPAVLGPYFCRHRLQLSVVEHVQEQGLEHIIAMMSQCDLRGSQRRGDAVQMAAAESGAQGAHRPPFRDQAFHDRVRVPLLDMKRDAQGAEI